MKNEAPTNMIATFFASLGPGLGLAIGSAMAIILLGVSAPADADILTVRAEGRAGAALGKGMFGERKDDAFHQQRGNLAYGVVVGAEFLFIDTWIQHDQFLGGGSVNGTWTQFMMGFDFEVDFDDKKSGGGTWFAELGMGVGFGVGTGQQVDPPLDNSEVTDKGFLVEGRALVAYRLNTLLSVGLTIPLQFGYFTKSGSGSTANNVDNHYSSTGGAAMFTLRSSWQLK